MRPHREHVALALFLTLLVVSCGRGASIEGDLTNGAAKGSFQRVSLVRNSGDSLIAAIDALCAADAADVQRSTDRIQVMQAGMERFRRRESPTLNSQAQVALSDSIEKYRLAASEAQAALAYRPDTIYPKILALVEAATDTQVEATVQGHFRFADRQPGKYLLYAEWLTDRTDDQFLKPVDASGGGKKRQNLDESAISTRLHCR